MFEKYRRTNIAEMRPYVEGEVLPDFVSISAADRANGSPKLGDMIARNPERREDQCEDQWLVAADYFAANFEPYDGAEIEAATQEPVAWRTDDYRTDKSATTYDPMIADRWTRKGWPVEPLYEFPPDAAREIERLTALLIEARDALRYETEANYPDRDWFPSDMRGYEHDMDLVHRIDAALAERNGGE